MSSVTPIYDSPTKFTEYEPVGPLTETRIDPFASNLVLLKQDYVIAAKFYRIPPYGCTHHEQLNATLVNVSPSENIGGGLVRITCTFVKGTPAAIHRDTARTYTFPGVIVPSITARETYEYITTLDPTKWAATQVEFNVAGVDEPYVHTVFQKEDKEERTRDITLRNVVLREPQAITVNVTQRITYCTTATPVGVSITGQGVEVSNVRNSRSRHPNRVDIPADDLNGIPETNQAFVIYGNSTSQAATNVANELDKKKSPLHVRFDYQIPTINNDAQITEYLSDTSNPTIGGYFGRTRIYLESTQIEQINGALYKYTDVFTTPR